MKKLIVNADDVGADEARNAGIFMAIEASSVTSASLLPNGPALEDAIQRIQSLKQKNISWGIHLNLSEGKSLSGGFRHITDPDGNFLGKTAAQRLLVHRRDAALLREIRVELESQILFLKEKGIPISHLDGHQHVHVFPAVVTLAAEAAKAHGIPWFRIPEEPDGDDLKNLPDTAIAGEARFFSGHASAARPLLQAMGIFATDHFRGLHLKGHLPASDWAGFLESLPNGLTELMVHPGYALDEEAAGNPFSRFSTQDREKELAALIDGKFHAALATNSVDLVSFPESGIYKG
jgi:predicted glycoside hydrolase/deacetylase ChbG (UPF0249 family)